MAKDYSKLKALAQQIIECIGDEPEGENPSLPKGDSNDNGTDENGGAQIEGKGMQEPVLNFIGNELSDGSEEPGDEIGDDGDDVKKKKKKESSLAMMGATLASRLGK